jgi:tetratricopeptide (TPR) repeat protein
MSLPTDPRPLQPAGLPEQIQRQRRTLRMISWVLLGVIFGSCTAAQGPREIGRWHLAAALNLRSKGEKEAAYQQLERAISWFPKSPELLLHRAEWRLEDGQRDEALADCDRMLEVGGESFSTLSIHSEFLQNAGEFAKAVDDWKKIEQASNRSGIPSRETALNGLAYAQALAEVDLDKALDHVNEALELVPNNANILDTRGFIFHLQGKDDLALVDQNRAVRGMDAELTRLERARQTEEADETSKLVASSYPKTLRGRALGYATQARATAVVHYHRALILSALGRQKDADQDRATAKHLIGREPDETLF